VSPLGDGNRPAWVSGRFLSVREGVVLDRMAWVTHCVGGTPGGLRSVSVRVALAFARLNVACGAPPAVQLSFWPYTSIIRQPP